MGISDKERRIMFLALMLGMVITSMATTAISNALPLIMDDMAISAGTAQWLVSGFTLAAGIMIPATPFLIRKLKNKTLFILAIALCAAGSILASFASAFAVVLIARILQGFGCGIIMSFVQVMILAIYPKERHGSIMGIYGLGCMVAPIAAPTVFGIIIDHMGWHMMFIVFFVLSVISILFALPAVKNVMPVKPAQFDTLSMILSAAGFCGILIGTGNMSSFPFLHFATGLPFILGAAALFAFSLKQVRGTRRLLDLSVFRNKNFAFAAILSVLLYFVLLGNTTLLPLFIQSMRGMSATEYALITLPGSALSAIVTVFAGRIFDRGAKKSLFAAGMLLAAAGCAVRIVSGADTGILNMALSNILISAGSGCVMMPLTALGLGGLGELRADGAAIVTTLRQMAGAIGAAAGVAVMSTAASHFDGNGYAGISAAYIFFTALSAAGLILSLFFFKKSVK
ncbi:MAG: DHA2 family efflux MFS transporter permease subunit [Clostridia bacterium]|nr:DHA2 family efflux MFS transporter permease subunit [Clostridia bacterium]